MIRPILVLAIVAVATCRTAPEPGLWVDPFPLLTCDDCPHVDSLAVLARDSFPEVPVERLNRVLGRDPDAPVTVQVGHHSGFYEKPDGSLGRGFMSMHARGGPIICGWHDTIDDWSKSTFWDCFRHTVGTTPGYEIEVGVSTYRPTVDFEYVKLWAVSVLAPVRR